MLLHTHISGEGPPVVLIHGLFGSYDNLGVIERSLSDQFQVINVDVRNHGQSPHHNQMTYQLMAEDLKETLAHHGIDRTAILGHSMGGKLAMAFALAYPQQVSKLVVADVAPVQYPPRHDAVLTGLAAVDLGQLTSRRQADEQLAQYISESGVRQFLLKSLVKEGDKFCWRFNLPALIDNYPQLISAPLSDQSYNGPVLFIKGGESDYILREHRPVILQLFPQAQAKIIQGTGHWLHAEKPAAFSKLVRDFLLS